MAVDQLFTWADKEAYKSLKATKRTQLNIDPLRAYFKGVRS